MLSVRVVLTSGVLGDGDEGFGLGIKVIWLHVEADELDIIVQSDYLASFGSLDVLLADVARLIVKESM